MNSISRLLVQPDMQEIVNERYSALLQEYKKKGSPISVNFRELVPINYGERATHMVHPYPAKLLPHIPAFFSNCGHLSSYGDVIFDPFCGSGTTLLEAKLAGRNGSGADSNPLARLISRVKTTELEPRRLKTGLSQIQKWVQDSATDYSEVGVVNIEYWYADRIAKRLRQIQLAIGRFRDSQVREFFQVSFSVTVRKVSYADPRISVPVRTNPSKFEIKTPFYAEATRRLKWLKKIEPLDIFNKVSLENISRMRSMMDMMRSNTALRPISIYEDSRSADGAKPKANLVITSPPYIGAQKYIRSSSLSLGWLGMLQQSSLRNLEVLNIGREHYHKQEYAEQQSSGLPQADKLISEIRNKNPLRGHIASTYLMEMREAFINILNKVTPDGRIVLISGPNRVTGIPFPTPEFLRQILEELGLVLELALVDEITSRGLMTKRNRTASIIESEWVFVFRRTPNG